VSGDELPLPPLVDPTRAADRSWRPDQQRLPETAVELRRTFAIRPAVEDAFRLHLLLVDFTPQAEADLERFAAVSTRLVRSTDPIATWPGR